MKITHHDNAFGRTIEVYPFLDADDYVRFNSGYVYGVSGESEVRFNINLESCTPEKWLQLSQAVAIVFDWLAIVREGA